jgi:hypothetical protein
MLQAITTIIFSGIAAMAIILGMDWINVGYGLHPIIAFPFATCTLIGAVYLQTHPIKDTSDEELNSYDPL